MAAFLIQVSGRAVTDHADQRYINAVEGPRYCDEPLRHDTYFNASPYWQRDGFGRHDAWETIESGDQVLLYCTGSVDEHGACLSHLLTVDEVSTDSETGARLTFDTTWELVPKLDYQQLQREVEAGRLSEKMGYCGQEGFNITEITENDVDWVIDVVDLVDPDSREAVTPHEDHPDDSLQSIADEYFGE